MYYISTNRYKYMKCSYKILISKIYLLNMPAKCYCYQQCSVSPHSLTNWLLRTTTMDVLQNGCLSNERCVVQPSHKQSVHKPAYQGSCKIQKFCTLHDNTECRMAETNRITNQEFSNQCVKPEIFTQARCSSCHSNNTQDAYTERF